MAQKKYVSLSKLSTFLDNLTNKFASLSHKHTVSDIDGLENLDGFTIDSELSPTSTNPVQNKVIDAEFEAISEALNVYDSLLDDKADASHTHEDYYTKTEIDESLSQKTQVQFIIWEADD